MRKISAEELLFLAYIRQGYCLAMATQMAFPKDSLDPSGVLLDIVTNLEQIWGDYQEGIDTCGGELVEA